MFRARTVFILGAGASAEVGLPVGNELLKKISNLLDISFDFATQKSGDRLIVDALRRILNENNDVTLLNEHLHAAWKVVASAEQALSIDNIVDGLEDKKVELVAKLGIVRAIHMSEKESNYFSIDQRTRRLDFRKFDTTWYSHLTKLICENRRVGELDKVFENLSFISFNYDRCIEAYLPWSIANYYQVNLDQVLEPFLKLSIHRPYGIAGEIDFRRARNEGPMGFGGNGVQYLAEAGSQIRTFTEGVENPERLDDLRRDISQADRIVFLGSAFHRQNLELLQTKIKEDAHVLATTGQISDPDLSVIRRELGEIFSIPSFMIEGRIVFAKMYCREFFETHWRTLTSG